jgi:hypothetical protein
LTVPKSNIPLSTQFSLFLLYILSKK